MTTDPTSLPNARFGIPGWYPVGGGVVRWWTGNSWGQTGELKHEVK